MTDTPPPAPAFREISAERFDDAFNVLPPITVGDGFLVSEPQEDRVCRVTGGLRATYRAFLRIGGRHHEAVESLTVPEFREFVAARAWARLFARADGGA